MTTNSVTQFHHLPEDTLLTVCDYAHADTILQLSQCSTFWNHFCKTRVWPRRVATCLGTSSVQFSDSSLSFPISSLIGPVLKVPNSYGWYRIFNTFHTHPSTRRLCLCVQLGPGDTITSLALRFAVSKHDICRVNCIFAEHQVASRTHLYIPLNDEQAVITCTGRPTNQHIALLIQDTALAKRYFAVIKWYSAPDSSSITLKDSSKSRESYVKQLLVKLMARGLAVHEDEVRFYLEDAQFDIPKAYKKLIEDHQFCP